MKTTSAMPDQPPAGEYPPCDPATVAPTRVDRKGRVAPDLLSNRASRVVTFEEARARGWPTFWDGRSCRYGHQAARWVSNPHACSDCRRIKEGLPTVYPGVPKGSRPYTFKDKAPAPPAAPIIVTAPATAPAPEPGAQDQRFLEALAGCRDFEQAAATVGTTAALIEARASCNAVFAKALTDLTARLDIRRPVPVLTPIVWDDTSRRVYLKVWVDTGDAATARDAVRATPSDFFDELERNAEFAAAVGRAKPLAAAALEDRAHQLALAGNSKLLEKLLASRMPNEYGDRLRLDLNVKSNLEKLTDDQINARILGTLPQLAAQFGYRLVRINAVDGEFTAVEHDEPRRIAGGTETARGVAAPEGTRGDAPGAPAGDAQPDSPSARKPSIADLL